jgi:fumarate reductase flavoprotein subunit
MKRRELVGSLLSMPLLSAPGRAQDVHWDLIVVGGGTAGLPAAIFAARRGARVLVLDAAKVPGGTMHLANGQVAAAGTRTQTSKGINDTPDWHFADIMRLSQGLADRELARITADHAPATLNWLLDKGLVPLPDHPVTGESPGRPGYGVPRYLWGAAEGRALLAVVERELAPEVAGGRVTLQLDSRVTELITDTSGAVTGVRAMSAGKTVSFRGTSVLLSTGGYAMSGPIFERLTKAPLYVASSYPFAQGDGLTLASSVGGLLRGTDLHRAGTGSILSGTTFPAKVYGRFTIDSLARAPWEIWVNNAGHRFIREDEPTAYARERAVVRQPQLRYAIVFDHEIFTTAPPGVAGWTREKMAEHFGKHPMFHRAETLEGLAAAAGLDPGGLRATVAAYNRGLAEGPDPLGRTHRPKPIARGPFYAVIHLAHSATSAVGVAVDRDFRVMHTRGDPIPGLFAAGEVLGSGATLGDAFVPGMMLTPALTFGRLLGERVPIRQT